MSGLFGSPSDHDRARELAAWRIDGPLDPVEEAWLDEHLATCDGCGAAAGDYATDRLLLRSLRDVAPEPPRDLWARTSAALDVERARHGEPRRSARPVVLGGSTSAPAGVAAVARSGWIPASIAIAAVAVIAVGAGLLNGQPAQSQVPAVALATPMVVAANIQVVGQGADGKLVIRTQTISEVCPVGADACSVAPSAATEPLAAVAKAPVVSEAILSPAGDRLVIVQGDDDAQGVYVVPVTSAAGTGPAGSPVAPTAPATPVPATATPEATAGQPTPDTTVDPGSSASPEPPLATGPPSSTPDPGATPSDEPGTATPEATDTPEATRPLPTEAPATPEPTPQPTPTVEVTPGQDGALQIASDVVVVGPVAAYNRAGTRFAFTARPADGSAGPNVYVWNTSDRRARAVTTDDRSVFAGWHSGDLVVSKVGDREGRTWLVDPVTRSETGPVSDGWLPTISPDRRAAVWWDGIVRFGRDGVSPVTGAGNLVIGPWERDGDTQDLTAGAVRGWSVAWDPNGTVLAVWQAGRNKDRPGALSLYRVAPDGRSVDLENPIRKDLPAFDGFRLDTDHLTWRAIGADGKPVVRLLAWNDDGVGIVELPADEGGTLVR